ncbi:MAG TPA: hypothetical protein PK771_13795 [Spirochaetota bacterium]|nr:hypothetical protein [Spirochaetota bacterium]
MKVFTTVNSKSISNIYFITDNDQKYGVLIDPGDFSLNVYRLIKQVNAKLTKIIITHNGDEQTNGIPLIKKIYNPEIIAHSDSILDFEITKVKDGSIIKEGDLEFKIMETPIHTYDSISILIDNALFVGDVLQAGALSSLNKKNEPEEFELKIIKKYFLSLSNDTVIYPSKGPATTLEREKI